MSGYGEEYDEEEERYFVSMTAYKIIRVLISFVGCIINVSSLLGVKGGKGSTVYAASKAGIIGLGHFHLWQVSIADLLRLDTIPSSGSRTYEHSSQCHRARLY